MTRRFLTELRAILDVLYRIAAGLLLTFLAGAFVGTFVAGCQTIASLAPVPR
jgi:hypothetical protein